LSYALLIAAIRFYFPPVQAFMVFFLISIFPACSFGVCGWQEWISDEAHSLITKRLSMQSIQAINNEQNNNKKGDEERNPLNFVCQKYLSLSKKNLGFKKA
jgi:hypothetical protein